MSAPNDSKSQHQEERDQASDQNREPLLTTAEGAIAVVQVASLSVSASRLRRFSSERSSEAC